MVSFDGIEPGETFTYRFKVRQSGTYWYHSHSGGQEQEGMYAPIVIEPASGERTRSDRDYVVMLSDQHAMYAGDHPAQAEAGAGLLQRPQAHCSTCCAIAAARPTEERRRSSPTA